MKKAVLILGMALIMALSPTLGYAQPLDEPGIAAEAQAAFEEPTAIEEPQEESAPVVQRGATDLRPTNRLQLSGATQLGNKLNLTTNAGSTNTNTSSGSKSFAQLAPTTRMSFVELVGDNGDYRAVTKFPAAGTYKLVVDLYHQVVMAYSKDSKGNYTVPVRYMVCTTGGPKTPTPEGAFKCKDSRRRFSQFSTGEYAQYWTRVVGEIYFHSLLYSKANANNYYANSYNLLGNRGSHGCIRLLVPDARWVYYNVAPGTIVQIRPGSKNDTATANIKRQLTRPALPKTRPNCNGVGSTDVWSIK